MPKSAARIILEKLIGFLIFMVLLGLANWLMPQVPNYVYGSVVLFLNDNIIFFLVLTLIGIANDLLWSFYFPFNIIAPIVSAFYSLFIVELLKRIWEYADLFWATHFPFPVLALQLVVFLVVLVSGYLLIIFRMGKPSDVWHAERKAAREARIRQKAESRLKEEKKRAADEKKNIAPDWEDVAMEFRKAMYAFGKAIRETFQGRDKPAKKSSGKKRK